MMKVILYILFMIPLVISNYWMVLFMVFIMTFYFMLTLKGLDYWSMISFYYGLDNYSYYFILLSFWICCLMFLANSNIYNKKNYDFMFTFMILFLMISLFMVFSSLNYFVFYLFFEVSLIPLVVIIIGWGYQPERLMAGMYMFFYTIFFSLPMMMGLFSLYNIFHSFMFIEISYLNNVILYFLMNMVFFVKAPMFMIHLWLPKAHVEAPISGSMILAGVVLKLGGYGLIRLLKIFSLYNFGLNCFFMFFSLVGSLYISLVCLYQTDLKMLIAYSSVSHMGMVLSSIFSMTLIGFKGSFIMMLAHGLCSSGLFCISNIYYDRLNSRSLYLIKGLNSILPNFSLFMFLFCVINMSAPPSLNLLGEILMMKSIVFFNSLNFIILVLISLITAVYSIYLYSYSNHGTLNSFMYSIYVGVSREYLLMFLHFIPLNVLLLFSNYFC